MRRPGWYLLSFVLLTTVGLALLGLGQAVSAPRATFPSSRPNAALAAEFYEAVNRVLETGDPGPLGAVVGPGFVAHGLLPERAADLAALQAHLLDLHAVFPDLRLEVAELVASRQTVAARVTTLGMSEGTLAGLPVSGSAGTWGTANHLVIAGDRVAELWSNGGKPASFAPLFAAPLAEPIGAGATLELERLWIGDGDAGDAGAPVDPAPRLVYLATGELAVSVVDGGAGEGRPRRLATVRGAAGSPDGGASRTIAPGGSTTVSPGEVLVLPGGTLYLLRAAGSGRASGLGLRVASAPPQDVPSESARAVAPAAAWPASVRAERLAASPAAEWPNDPTLRVVRTMLAPGAVLALDLPTGAAAVAVETGAAGLAVTRGQVWVTPRGSASGTDGAGPAAAGLAAAGAGDHLVVPAGGWALLGPETAVSVLTADQAPVSLLLLTVLPPEPAGAKAGGE